MADLSLLGKVAIVTGASRGIGEGLAVEFTRRGAKVVITYTSASSSSKADAVIARITELHNGSSAIKVKADLRSLEGPSQIIDATLKAFPNEGISILVNNAGCEVQKRLTDLTAADLAFVHDLNVRGTMLMTQAVLPHLKRPGRIINIGSVAAREGFPGYSLYCSSKAAVEAFTRSWAAELGGEGHTVNCVNPGPVDTEMIYQINPEIVEMQKKNTPVEHRLATVDDIAQICVFLAEERSRWVSGQTLSATGGLNMY